MSEFPMEGRLIGIDYGTRRIGLAVCDPGQFFAGPLDIVPRTTNRALAAVFAAYIEEYKAVGFVIGLPVHKSGEESAKSKEVRHFGEWLGETCALPVRYWDERHTTQIAEMYLHEAEVSAGKRASQRDAIAAQVILQAYLDAEDRAASPPDLT